MVSRWNSEPQQKVFPSSVMQNSEDFTFVDFFPHITDDRGIFTGPTYESFRRLIERANGWLQENRKWKIITCETVEFRITSKHADSSKMSYAEFGESANWYTRGLRLWLTEKQDSKKEQKIGLLNMVPQPKGKSGIFQSISFETLDDIIHRYNSMMQTNPIQGRVISIESQEMKLETGRETLDPDLCNWYESGDSAKRFLFVIRIFYEMNDINAAENLEEIGLADFVPSLVKLGGVFSLPTYEPFSSVMTRSLNWCSQQREIRFCNAKALEIKMTRGNQIDTQKMDFVEHGTISTVYLRILRVAYTRPSASKHVEIESPSFSCKTFVPVQLPGSILTLKHETLQETKYRISAWLKATGSRVLCAETEALRIKSRHEARYGTDASLTYNTAERTEYRLFVIRLYLHGVYQEPPAEMLPPVPEMGNQDRCDIM